MPPLADNDNDNDGGADAVLVPSDVNIFAAPDDNQPEGAPTAQDDREAYQRELRGKLRKCTIGFGNPDTSWLTSLLVSRVLPFNWFTTWMLARQSERPNNPGQLSTSIILDIKYEPASPSVVARQYLSARMCEPMSSSPIAHLLGFKLNRDRVDTLHTAFLTADGATYIRFEFILEELYPWRWIGTADVRRTDRTTLHT